MLINLDACAVLLYAVSLYKRGIGPHATTSEGCSGGTPATCRRGWLAASLMFCQSIQCCLKRGSFRECAVRSIFMHGVLHCQSCRGLLADGISCCYTCGTVLVRVAPRRQGFQPLWFRFSQAKASARFIWAQGSSGRRCTSATYSSDTTMHCGHAGCGICRVWLACKLIG